MIDESNRVGLVTYRGFFTLLQPLGYRIKFQLPFNNIKCLSDYSRRWQVKGQYAVN